MRLDAGSGPFKRSSVPPPIVGGAWEHKKERRRGVPVDGGAKAMMHERPATERAQYPSASATVNYLSRWALQFHGFTRIFNIEPFYVHA